MARWVSRLAAWIGSRRRWLALAGGVVVAGAGYASVAYPVFDASVFVSSEVAPGSVVAADATGDGNADLVAVVGKEIVVRPSHGDGTFGDPFTLPTPQDKGATHLLAARLNADAYDDFVIGQSYGAALFALLSDGSGGYATARLAAAVAPQQDETGVPVVADWDGDGDVDVLRVEIGKVLSWLNDGGGSFAEPEVAHIFSPAYVSGAAAADLDGDGRTDLVVCGDFYRQIVLMRQEDGSLAAEQPLTPPPWSHDYGLAIGDLDRDGLTDIALYHVSHLPSDDGYEHGLTVFRQTSPRRFAAPVTVPDGQPDDPTRLVAADVNGDGWLDLVVARKVFTNKRDGTFLDPLYFAGGARWSGAGNYGPAVAAGHFDADSRADIIVTEIRPDFAASGNRRGIYVFSSDADEPLPIVVASMEPATLAPGTTGIVFTGDGFEPGVTVDLGRGIAVTGVTFESETRLRATATVPHTARPVSRLAVLRNSPTSVGTVPFRVVNPAAAQVVVTALTPDSIRPGESARVIVDGSGFAGPIVAQMLPGVHVTTTTVDSATRLTLDLTATTTATVGSRSLLLTDDWGDTVVQGAFDVLAAPTLDLAQTTGRTRLKKHGARDAFSVEGTIAFNAASPDGTFDPSAEAVEIRFGDPAAPQVVAIPALKGWTVRKGRATWKSGKRAQPRVTFSVDLSGGAFRLDVTRADLVVPGPGVEFALTLGSEEGADVRPWETARDGLRLR